VKLQALPLPIARLTAGRLKTGIHQVLYRLQPAAAARVHQSPEPEAQIPVPEMRPEAGRIMTTAVTGKKRITHLLFSLKYQLMRENYVYS
jgi:hypothetical protein